MDRNESQLYIGKVAGGRYEILEFLGAGKFSGVFIGLDRDTGRDVAVKVLSLGRSGSPDAVFEFQEDVRLLRLLATRSNVVDILDDGMLTLEIPVAAGLVPTPVRITVPYMVLELAVGGLDRLLLRRHEVSWVDKVVILREAVKGVHQMHCERIVHRDLKADNVLLFDTGPVKAKITDLGRSRNTREAPRFASAYEVPRGMLAFAPPELLWRQGTDDPVSGLRADLYLLGSLLFEMVTGQGITAMVFPNPRAILDYAENLSPIDRAREYLERLPDMREQYEHAYRVFEAEIPRVVADEAAKLLRQLTDPMPEARELKRPFRNLPTRWDLNWLLQKIDILIKALSINERPPRRYRRGKVMKP
jgi:eukaryotic-like serine/threonine-protein kinase